MPQPVVLQTAPATDPNTASVVYQPTAAPAQPSQPNVGPGLAPQRLSIRDRPSHFEFGFHFAGVYVPVGGGASAIYPNVTLGMRNRWFDLHFNVGYLHTTSTATEGNGLAVGVDPRFWFGPYGVGVLLGVAPLDFTAVGSGGWRGLSVGVVTLVTPLALQFGTGKVRFETSLRIGTAWFPDRRDGLKPMGFLSIGLVFG